MKQFMGAANFKRATLTYLASKLPEKNLEDLRKIFIQMDLNGDGRIETAEFKEALTSIGMKFTNDEVKELMGSLDTNNSGFIDYTEFLAGCMRSKLYLKEDLLKAAFEYFDKDSSGAITKEELRNVLSSDDIMIPDCEIDKIIEEVDFNKDGHIDYGEFIDMMKKDL